MKNFIIFPIVIVIALYAFLSLVVPTYKNINALKEQNIQQENELKALVSDVETLSGLRAEINNDLALEDVVKEYIPQSATEEEALNNISRFAELAGLNLFTVSFTDQHNNRNFRTQDIDSRIQFVQGEIIATGNYDQVKQFTQNLFKANRITVFNNLVLNSIESSEDSEVKLGNQITLEASFQYGYTTQDDNVVYDASWKRVTLDSVQKLIANAVNVQQIQATAVERLNPFGL